MPTTTRAAGSTPTIGDLVAVLAQRDGVQAAVLLGRDGLVIEARSAPGVDAEHLAAHVPALVAAAEELGAQARRGAVVTLVTEFEHGMAVSTSLTPEVLLLVLLHGSASLGPLLFDLRRHRANIASIV